MKKKPFKIINIKSCFFIRMLIISIGVMLLINPATAEDAKPSSGILDGMVFKGLLGPEENPDSEDEIHFSNGKFWSKLCTKCGFQPGHYWVRKVGDTIHFRGELISERGVFDYRGEIKDGKLNAKMDWTIKRWYWSIHRDYAFTGSLKPDIQKLTAGEATEAATLAMANLPDSCQ